MTIKNIRGVAPIGSIVGWLKSFSNIPTLANQNKTEWVEVNGATISDTESPLNGQTLPDLNRNSDNYFLRGNTTSGGTGGVCNHCHSGLCITMCSADQNYTGSTVNALCCLSTSLDATTHLPPYYDVVYLIRSK